MTFRARIDPVNEDLPLPFDLLLGDGVFYKHKQTGVEIRLFRHTPGPDSDLRSSRLEGSDKHGNIHALTGDELFCNYYQRRQSDFTDPVDPRLPYLFDLHWDIKTLSQLKAHLASEPSDPLLGKMIKDHDIKL